VPTWFTLGVEVEVDDNVLRASLVIKNVASTLREVSYQQVAAENPLVFWFIWLRITHKAESLVEF
jgi:hypothetical protein